MLIIQKIVLVEVKIEKFANGFRCVFEVLIGALDAT